MSTTLSLRDLRPEEVAYVTYIAARDRVQAARDGIAQAKASGEARALLNERWDHMWELTDQANAALTAWEAAEDLGPSK